MRNVMFLLVLSLPFISPGTSHASRVAASEQQPCDPTVVRASCEKMRVDAGYAWVDPIAPVAVEACVRNWGLHHPELAPDGWRESEEQARAICTKYLNGGERDGSDIRSTPPEGTLEDCVEVELNH